MRVFTLLLISVCLVPITGLADNFTVGCPGGAGTYPTITAALNALRASSDLNHTVTISGTCTESVNVSDFENVELVGTTGATITALAGPPVQVVFSKNITLRDLDIQGDTNPTYTGPVIRVSDSSLDILGCTMEGGRGSGVEAVNNSRVNIYRSTIQDNQGTGVLASGNSSVGINGSQAQKTVIQHNNNGVVASGGSSVSIVSSIAPPPAPALDYGVEVLGNLYYGVSTAGSYVTFGGNGQTRIADNGYGVAASRGGTVDKGGGGILLVEHNTDSGVASWLGGSILLAIATIDSNGGPSSTLPDTADVAVDRNSTAMFINVTIRNSLVTGLLVRDNASVVLVGSTITGNGDDGVRIETLSGVRFQGDQSTVTGNSGSDLVCDSDTYVVVAGDSPNIGKAKCPSFKKKK
jgi:hypothetical protein